MTSEQLKQNIVRKLSGIDEKMRAMLETAISKATNNRDIELIEEWLLNPKKWQRPRVSIDTFLDSPYYLGIGKNIYPEVRKICHEIVNGKYSEGVVVAGIGSGKTTLSEVLACYSAHTLLCMRSAHANYNLVGDKPIAIMNMGISSTQAQEVTFAGIRSMIERSPFFQEYAPEILMGTVRFQNEKIYLMAGNSKSTTPLGYNIFYAILDEAAFYMDNDNRSVAEEIYTALQRRIVSRFGNDGLIMMISSPRYVGDFIMKKLDEGRQHPHIVYTKQLPTWKMKPYSSDTLCFFYNARAGVVFDAGETKADILSQALTIGELGAKFEATDDVWEIPQEYYKSFKQNPEQAKRDFAALPSLTLEAFFPHPETIARAFKMERPNPVKANGDYIFPDKPTRNPHYIHIDLALNRKGGDFGGLCMAHFDGWDIDLKAKERRKKVYVDLVERLEADPKLGEIDFEKVRQKIYALKDMGYNIALVTFDQFQSAEISQMLKKKSIKCDLLSVDRTAEPYNTLKELINENRISIHEQPKCQEELGRLEIIKGSKIDHPSNGSKDLADALCGAVYNVITNTKSSSMGVMSGDYYNDNTITKPYDDMTEDEKVEYNRERAYKRVLMLEEMNKRGDFLK